jgi:hypothetical protein
VRKFKETQNASLNRIAECEQSHGNLLWNGHLDRLKADADHKNKNCQMCSILNTQRQSETYILRVAFDVWPRTSKINLIFSGESVSEWGVATGILRTDEVADCPT